MNEGSIFYGKGGGEEVKDRMSETIDSDIQEMLERAVNDALELKMSCPYEDGEINPFTGECVVIIVNAEGAIVAGVAKGVDKEDLYYAEAADKAKAHALLHAQGKLSGLDHDENFATVKKLGFEWHTGTAIEPLEIDGKPYFIGVSGASVVPEYFEDLLGGFLEQDQGSFGLMDGFLAQALLGVWSTDTADEAKFVLKETEQVRLYRQAIALTSRNN